MYRTTIFAEGCQTCPAEVTSCGALLQSHLPVAATLKASIQVRQHQPRGVWAQHFYERLAGMLRLFPHRRRLHHVCGRRVSTRDLFIGHITRGSRFLKHAQTCFNDIHMVHCEQVHTLSA